MQKVSDVLRWFDSNAPFSTAEDWDNVGLLLGDPAAPAQKVGVCLDATPSVLEQMIQDEVQLVVSHHPLIFGALKKITVENLSGRALLKMAQSGMSYIAAHTNWDFAPRGINFELAKVLKLEDPQPLGHLPMDTFAAIVSYVPESHLQPVLDAMAAAGAGAIGDYDRCAFYSPGTGTFRPLEGADPYVGKVGEVETTSEIRLEVVCPPALLPTVLDAHHRAHPYEEPAVFAEVTQIARRGSLSYWGKHSPCSAKELATLVSERLGGAVRVFGPEDATVASVAVVGGSGSGFWKLASSLDRPVLVTGEVKHHDGLEAAEAGVVVIEAGHAETEEPGMKWMAKLLSSDLAFAARFYR
ncbi:MAG: Nif3-like dinuclear metal center hexameric protein [Fimbriimonadaceae bacterium]